MLTTLVFFNDMRYKNNVFTGILLGALLPGIAWLVFDGIWKDVLVMRKHGVPYLIVIVLNLLILRYCYKKDAEQTGMGVMLVTFAFALMVFMIKFKQ